MPVHYSLMQVQPVPLPTSPTHEPRFYVIRHATRFRYSSAISESVMELRMCPRTATHQRTLSFHASTNPRAQLFEYTDHLQNIVHHFNITRQHKQLFINVEAVVQQSPTLDLPPSLTLEHWQKLDQMVQTSDYWEMLQPSYFAKPTDLLLALAQEFGLSRQQDPLTTLRLLTSQVYHTFQYTPNATQVDSPIDDALRLRKGVCQDFSHVMISLCRWLGIPARYVSGYLFHREQETRVANDATHAWVEALLPDLGWVGFDPTANRMAGVQHIRVALGRDYEDVPPTKGIFRGTAESELSVAVQVLRVSEPNHLPPQQDLPFGSVRNLLQPEAEPTASFQYQQQQQQ